jgi:hypothetical protein
MDIKDHAKNTDTWLRGFFILVFGVIFYFLYIIIWLLVIFQFLTKVLTGELNSNLEQLSMKMTSYALQILNYITYQSEERPYPFSPFPEGNSEAQNPKAIPSRKVSKKKKTVSKKDED